MALAFGGFWQSVRFDSSEEEIFWRSNQSESWSCPHRSLVGKKKQKRNRVKCLWPKKCERSPCLVLLCWGRQVVVKKKRKKEKGVLSQVCQHLVVWECFVYLGVIQLRIMKSTSCWFLQPLFEVTSGRSADAAVRLQESSFYVISFDESKNSLTHRWFPCPPDFQIHLSPGNFA